MYVHLLITFGDGCKCVKRSVHSQCRCHLANRFEPVPQHFKRRGLSAWEYDSDDDKSSFRQFIPYMGLYTAELAMGHFAIHIITDA